MKQNRFHRILSTLLACLLILSLAACGTATPAAETTPAASTEASATATSASAEAATPSPMGALVSDKPIVLTAHIHNANTEVLNDDWRVLKKAAELTNVSLKGTASVNETDSTNAFNLMIAGKDIPDLVGGTSVNLIKYGMEGAFMPLEDLIAEHAPNIQKMLDAKPEVRAAITAADGHIYYLPTLEDSQVSQAWFIRKDWLDKLGLQVPGTVEELHQVMLAFASKDPNGNGKKDEIGYLNRNGLGGDLTGNITSLFSLYGVNTTFHIGKDGKVALGAYSPAFKDAMKSVSQWYAEGLIDPEIFTRGGKSRDVLFSANNGGLTHDWYPSTSSYNAKMQEAVPGFKLVGMLPPVDSNGEQWEMESRQTVTGIGTAVSATNKYPVETIKYLDFWWTPEGERLATYGIEGDTYVMQDGKPVFTDTVLKADVPVNAYMKSIGGQQYQLAHTNLSAYEAFMMTPEGVDALTLYQTSGVVNKLYPKLPAMSFTQEETDLIQSKWPVISTYIVEQLQKWTFDGSSIDAGFDKYLADIRGMGVEEILAAYQAAYDRMGK